MILHVAKYGRQRVEIRTLQGRFFVDITLLPNSDLRAHWHAPGTATVGGQGLGLVNTAQFQVGDLIHHKRYDYRGVIVQIDDECRADEQWYQSNQTQPERDQPWYHVLVDGSTHTTYLAQEKLKSDTSGKPVDHPLLNQFFGTFLEGRYYRENLN